MRNLYLLSCAWLVTAGLSGNALAAGDTENGQSPAAPAAAGADTEPDKPATAVVSHSATVITNGSKQEEKGATAPDANKSNKP
jgi:hypothetical protein